MCVNIFWVGCGLRLLSGASLVVGFFFSFFLSFFLSLSLSAPVFLADLSSSGLHDALALRVNKSMDQ